MSGPSEWSWKVRYAAMNSLLKIHRSEPRVPSMDGIQLVAWNAVVQAQSDEKDLRVTEAFKVDQVIVSDLYAPQL